MPIADLLKIGPLERIQQMDTFHGRFRDQRIVAGGLETPDGLEQSRQSISMGLLCSLFIAFDSVP
jgi:hypothetical protein